MNYLEGIYIIIAIIFVVWQGFFYYSWHSLDKSTKGFNAKEVFLNLLGSVVGWTTGYFLLFYRFQNGFEGFKPNISDLVYFLLAFYGMTGNLPHILLVKLKLGRDN